MIFQGVSEEDDTFACAYLESFLSRTALVFYKQRNTSRNAPANFAEWVDVLREAFPEKRDSDVHQMLIYDRKQRVSETVTEYEAELKRLAALATGPRENIIRTIFLRGLLPDIRDVLKFMEFSNLGEASKAAKFIESQLFRDTMNNATKNLQVTTTQQGGDSSRQVPKQLIREAIGEMQHQKACYGCGSVFHLMRDCPKRKRRMPWYDEERRYGKRPFRKFNPTYRRPTTPYVRIMPRQDQPMTQGFAGRNFTSETRHKRFIKPKQIGSRNKVNLITTQRGLESIQGKNDFNLDLIAHVFITVP